MTLRELADEAWARGEEKIFFRVSGLPYTYRVRLTRDRNLESFTAFNTRTQCFEWVKGKTVVPETTA